MKKQAGCPLCGHPEQAQIEAEFIDGVINANDVVAKIGRESIDILGTLVHMDEHELAMGKEITELKELMDPKDVAIIMEKEAETPVSYEEPYEEESLPVITDRKQVRDIDTLKALHRLYWILDKKLRTLLTGKSVQGVSQIVGEMRKTMIDIDRVKKEQKASLADRTDELLEEFDELNDWLLFNLCDECTAKLEKVLKGEEEIQTISPERIEVKEDGQDRDKHRADATNR